MSESNPINPEYHTAGRTLVNLHHLYTSEAHNFFGHHGEAAGDTPVKEVGCLYCIKGRGVVGDRFFDYKENYKGQITFFSVEVFTDLCTGLKTKNCSPSAVRRNVILEGVDLNLLIGKEFEINGVRFGGTEECRPCDWMNEAIGPGAEEFLKGRGGLRARILSDGWLRRGTTDLLTWES